MRECPDGFPYPKKQNTIGVILKSSKKGRFCFSVNLRRPVSMDEQKNTISMKYDLYIFMKLYTTTMKMKKGYTVPKKEQ